jgi:undecaprenyl-diphosphatase
MDLLQTLLLALVEGVTEFLPVSSTGHLILSAHLLHIPQTEFVKSFEIIIQLGAILAVVVLYWNMLLHKRALWKTLFIAFVPSIVVGSVFYKLIKSVLIGNPLITVIALIIGGVIMIVIEKRHPSTGSSHKTLIDITPKQAVFIGLAQTVSVIPGVSRAGATIVGALLQKIDRKTAVEFSFLLAVPTMIAATTLDVFETKLAFSQQELGLLAIGFVASFVVALGTIKYFLKFVENSSFISFGIYRIVIGILYFLLVLS